MSFNYFCKVLSLKYTSILKINFYYVCWTMQPLKHGEFSESFLLKLLKRKTGNLKTICQLKLSEGLYKKNNKINFKKKRSGPEPDSTVLELTPRCHEKEDTSRYTTGICWRVRGDGGALTELSPAWPQGQMNSVSPEGVYRVRTKVTYFIQAQKYLLLLQ